MDRQKRSTEIITNYQAKFKKLYINMIRKMLCTNVTEIGPLLVLVPGILTFASVTTDSVVICMDKLHCQLREQQWGKPGYFSPLQVF